VLVVTLLAINDLDHPYGKAVGSIEPTAMERSLVLLDDIRRELGSTDAVPCDERGVASG
jgi:hypothetical protein